MPQNSQVHQTLLAYLRHELCTPINGMIGYSELLLEELQTQQESTLFRDLQKIHACSQQLLTLVSVILDPAQLEMSQIDGDLSGFSSTLRMELLTPLSTIIGYCEMSLEEAPAKLIPDLDKLYASAQQLMGLIIENLYCSSLYPSLSQFSPESDRSNSFSEETQSPFQSARRLAAKRLEKPAAPTDQPTSTSKIVAVNSFRGGTGKSNLTSNLAISVAKQGKRVGVIDTDLQSPGIHVLFGLDDEAIDRTLNDYLWGHCALYEAAYELSHILPQQPPASTPDGGIYLIPASVKANDITRILREGFNQEMLLDGFSEIIHDLQLDFLFIDTHPGINEETLQAIAVCSLLVVVLRPDYQDYQGTSVIVELARMLSVSEMLLIVNKALPTFDVETYRQQLEAAYEVSVAGILPFSEEMMHLASSGIFSVRYPNHSLAKAVDAIGKHIIEQREAPCSC